MDFLAGVLSQLLRDVVNFSSQQPALIMGATAVLSACCAFLIFTEWKFAIPEERWARMLGMSFAIYAIEFGAASMLRYLIKHQFLPGAYDQLVFYLMAAGSAATNFFFIAAARELRGMKKPFPWPVIVLTALYLLLVIRLQTTPFHRLPDAFLSAYCIGYLVLSISLSLGASSYKRLSRVSMIIVILYGSLQLLYSLLTTMIVSRASWTNAMFLEPLDESKKLQTLDAYARALSLPFKLGLFILIFFLFIQAYIVVSSSEARKMHKGLIEGNQEYFSNDGVAKSIGEILGATEVLIFLLSPGRIKAEGTQILWDSQSTSLLQGKTNVIPLHKNRVAEIVIKEGRSIIHSKPIGIFTQIKTNFDLATPQPTMIAVPIRFHGATIGCLCVKWENKISVAKTIITQINQLADLISPTAQSHREIAALDRLSYRFTRWHAQIPSIESNGEALKEVVDILHDTLSPLVTAVSIDFGFETLGCLRQLNHGESALLHKEISDDDLRANLLPEAIEEIEIIRSPLYIRKSGYETTKSRQYLIGELVFVVQSQKDAPTQPTLVRQYLHRRAVRALVADILLEISRQHLNSVQKSFAVRLNKQKASNVDEWFYEVYRAARAAGLQWIVISASNENQPWRGSSQARIKSVEALERTKRITQANGKLLDEIRAIPLIPPESATHYIIKQYLHDSKTWVWMGVGRLGFGSELDFHSPWKIFLERFGQTADATFHHLRTSIESQEFQHKAAQAEALAKVTVMTGTLLHDITNLVKDLNGSISALNDDYKIGRLDRERLGESIQSMRETTEELLELSRNMSNATKTDSQSPCNLLKAVESLNRRFAGVLKQEKIFLEIAISPELEIDIPMNVASMAIAELVKNAKEAHLTSRTHFHPSTLDGRVYSSDDSKEGDLLLSNTEILPKDSHYKLIRIEAIDSGEMVHCHVIDNGPGIPKSLDEYIFNLGESTKPEGGGWGLYLVKQSLQLHRGAVGLTKTGPDGAQFTILFPKPRPEAYDGQ